ncbi:serine/threonine-protein kinase [Mycolicibacterium bacteremicum]|uniref:serine/threonine-protein kinase n=1 Tax=Mycolicibacterium bacteremicum TaxID=564198 RepID=UPI0026F222F7|nr:serine/threonine-protein kinase [Mycolicibacterium bacteremicum]
MPLKIGDTFAGYRVLRLLGSGGMGEVYGVQHPRLPRQEALKVLRPDFSQDESFRERFIREAELAAGLRHPNIVAIHDRGEHDGQLWIAMDYIDGTDLSQLLEQRYPQGMPVGHVLPIVTAVASALDYAHKKGFLHRDVKPANIIVADLDTDDPKTFLADFGIARPLDDTGGITTTNMTVGTVAYAAPEQLMGDPMDGRADQYALAATTYHLLTGEQVFRNSNPAVVISRHLNAPAPLLADARTELASLDPVLAAGLAKAPDDRFTSTTDFARTLAETVGPAGASTVLSPAARMSHTKRGVDESCAGGGSTDQAGRRRISISIAASLLLLIVLGALWRPWQQPTSDIAIPASTVPATSALTSTAVAPPPASTAPQPPPPPDTVAAPQDGYFTDVRRAFHDWNHGQGMPDTSGTNRVLTEVFDWVCQRQDAEPNVVNQQIQMQETWFNHPSLQLFEANRLRSIALSHCSNSPAPALVTTTSKTPLVTPSTESSPTVAYDAVCSYLYSRGDQWPDGPYLHRWMLERYPDLPTNQVDNILEMAFQDPACQAPPDPPAAQEPTVSLEWACSDRDWRIANGAEGDRLCGAPYPFR